MSRNATQASQSLEAMSKECRIYEAVVAGAGPAGSAIAANLARAGMDVLICDKAANDWHKAGEFVPPLTRAFLKQAHLLGDNWEESHLATHEFISSWGSERPTSRNFIFDANGYALVLNRLAFDRSLLSEATSRGVILLRDARIIEVDRSNDTWTLLLEASGSRLEVRCAFLVLAHGRRGNRLKALEIRRYQVDKLICFGLMIDGYDGDARPSVEAYENGWAYSVRIPSGRLLINLFTEADRGRRLVKSLEFLMAEVAQCSLASSRILSSQPRYPEQVEFFVADASSAFRRPTAGRGWCLAGDQAQSMDPLSSNGIFQALHHAVCVSEAIIASSSAAMADLSTYSAELEKCYQHYLLERERVYSLEKRWSTPFWTKRWGSIAEALFC
jgi:flavin-dependent dehydrogenase